MKTIFQGIRNCAFVKMLMESIGDGVFAIDTEGRIILWNPAMEHITGYLAEEAMGKGCRILGFNNCFGKECPQDFTECGILEKGKIEPPNACCATKMVMRLL